MEEIEKRNGKWYDKGNKKYITNKEAEERFGWVFENLGWNIND